MLDKHQELTGQIIKAFYMVYNTLGYGFLEKVYENALAIDLKGMGLHVAQQAVIEVCYKNNVVGRYEADLLVENAVILELKAVRELAEEHEAQLLNYLKATRYEVGLLLNFGPKPTFVRKAFDNNRKGMLKWIPEQ